MKLHLSLYVFVLCAAVLSACNSAQLTPTSTPDPTATLPPLLTSTAVPSPTSTPVPTGWDYVALGDSNPRGFGVSHPYVDIYGKYIARDLGFEARVHNWAFDGAKTSSLLAKLRNNTELQQDIRDAEIVTIDIGGNDWTSALHRYPTQMCGGADNQDCLRKLMQSYSENLEAILAEIESLHGTDSVLHLRLIDLYMSNCDYPNIYGNGGIFKDIKPYLDQFNADIAQIAEGHHALIVPLYVTMNGPAGDQNPLDYIQNDQCHLNINGHQTVADMLRQLGYEDS